MSALTRDAMLGVVVASVPIGLYVATWLTLALGRPYSRARPRGVRLIRIAGNVSITELIISAAWAVALPDTVPFALARVSLAVTAFFIPAFVIAVALDTMRGGVPASRADQGDE